MDTPREVLIHASVHRPRLILGADRELVIALGLICSILIFGLVTWWSIIFGVLLWVIGIAFLARIGKIDALIRPIYLRHIKYQAFYRAKSSPLNSGVRLPRGWR